MRRVLRASVATALLGVAGCSLWVSSEPEQIGCADEGKLGPPACDDGFLCAHQSCVHCAANEICGDAVDNDCNGKVDDGCSSVSGGGGSAVPVPEFAGAPSMANPAGGARGG